MRSALLKVIIIALLSCAPCSAEIYRNIGPLDTLSDLRAKFPGAKFEQIHPAWAQEQDVLYSVTGAGMSGTIVVKFWDGRPAWRKQLASEVDEERRKLFEDLSSAPDDSIEVEWVRWIPVEPIPLQRFASKYGPPDEKGFSDEDLEPYRNWKKGLVAYLTDDEKLVTRVDYRFTQKEHCAAWKQRYPELSSRPECRGALEEPKSVPPKAKAKSKAKKAPK